MTLLDRGFAIARGGARQAGRLGGYALTTAGGMVERARKGSRGPKAGMSDQTIKDKVETELFRGADAPKSKVNITVVNGIVQLRGQVKNPAEVRKLEAKAEKVPEVRGVENLLHLPKTPSRTRTDSPARQRREKQATSRSGASKTKAAGRSGRSRTTAESGRAKAGEPKPDELAAKREGRPAAPMGSTDAEGGGSTSS